MIIPVGQYESEYALFNKTLNPSEHVLNHLQHGLFHETNLQVTLVLTS